MELLFSILIILIAGRAVLSLFDLDGLNAPVRAVLYLFGGSVVISLYMFFLSVLGVKFSVFAISVPFLIFLVYDIGRSRPGFNFRMPQISKPGLEDIVFALTFIVLGLVVISVFLNNCFIPVFRADAIAHWMFQAKIFFVERRVPLDVLLKKVYDYRADYPLLVPLNLAWISICLQSWQETTVRTLFSLQYLGAVTFFYYSLKKRTGKLFALMSSLMVFSLPILLAHAENGYADLTLAAYAMIATVFFFEWLMERKDRDIYLAAFFIGGAAWTKNDGIALVIAMVVSLIAHLISNRSDIKRSAVMIVNFILISAVVFVPFKIFTMLNSIGSHMITSMNVFGLAAQGLGRVPLISKHFGYEMFLDAYQWMYFWIYAILFLALRKRELGQVAAYVSSFVHCPFACRVFSPLHDNAARPGVPSFSVA